MENVNSEFRKKDKNLLTEIKEIFVGNGKLKDCKWKPCVYESVQPIALRLIRFLYHMRRVITEEIKRLEYLHIIEEVEGPHDLISNLAVVPQNGKVRLCLDAPQ